MHAEARAAFRQIKKIVRDGVRPPQLAASSFLSSFAGNSGLFAPSTLISRSVLTDDFHWAGRVSGAKRIPISELKVDSFHRLESRRLQVNASTIRCQQQLKYLASMI